MSTMAAAPGIHIDRRMKIYLNDETPFGWPALLNFLGWGSIYHALPVFDSSNPVFQATVSTLCSNGEREVVYHVYDHLFAECLRQIQSLPQLIPPSLIQAIERVSHPSDSLSAPALCAYTTALTENPAHAMHDLILYLSWDRMCLWMGRLFDHQESNANFIQALALIKECLIESYMHLSQDGRTEPGIFRMIEALFYYEMREENLQKHSSSDWELLSKSFQALSSQDEIVSVPYIDDAVMKGQEDAGFVSTRDPPELVSLRQALSVWMMDRLKTDAPEWKYRFKFPKIRDKEMR